MSGHAAVVEKGRSADLRCDEWYTKVCMQLEVGDTPGSVGKGAYDFVLEALKDLRVRGLRTSPQLNSVCPHGLEDTFVEEEFV